MGRVGHLRMGFLKENPPDRTNNMSDGFGRSTSIQRFCQPQTYRGLLRQRCRTMFKNCRRAEALARVDRALPGTRERFFYLPRFSRFVCHRRRSGRPGRHYLSVFFKMWGNDTWQVGPADVHQRREAAGWMGVDERHARVAGNWGEQLVPDPILS